MADAKQLLQYKRTPAARPPMPQAQPQPQRPHSQSQAPPSSQSQPPSQTEQRPKSLSQPPQNQQQTASAPMAPVVYDVVWETGLLGLRFTPSENDEPVVCQITDKASEGIRRSPVTVGDVVVAVQVHAIGAPMVPVVSMQELVQVFKHEELPITVRFRSRSKETPESIALVDIARSYTYTWPPGQPLGVSLAMDPCTLHTIITSIDEERISPEFLPLEPTPGDILISVRDLERKADLDNLRFDQAVEVLKTFPRPCKLTFARLHEEAPPVNTAPPPPSFSSLIRSFSGRLLMPTSASQSQAQAPAPVPPAPSSEPQRAPPRRPAPLMKRQSFAVEEMKPQQSKLSKKEEAKKKARRDARFYKIVYSGGHIGLVLQDASLELKGKPKKNGYYALIKKISNKKALEGLDQASEGDELIAIGTHDLQHVAFDDVQRELMGIREPTPLVFQRKPAGNVSVGAALVDGLFLMLI